VTKLELLRPWRRFIISFVAAIVLFRCPYSCILEWGFKLEFIVTYWADLMHSIQVSIVLAYHVNKIMWLISCQTVYSASKVCLAKLVLLLSLNMINWA
jgi:hypothetical protein